jgi:hypothetical protein
MHNGIHVPNLRDDGSFGRSRQIIAERSQRLEMLGDAGCQLSDACCRLAGSLAPALAARTRRTRLAMDIRMLTSEHRWGGDHGNYDCMPSVGQPVTAVRGDAARRQLVDAVVTASSALVAVAARSLAHLAAPIVARFGSRSRRTAGSWCAR